MDADRTSIVERRSGGDRRQAERRGPGRPPVGEASTTITLRAPGELIDRLCRASQRRGETPSETHRRLLAAALSFDEVCDGDFVTRNQAGKDPGRR